VGVSVCAKVGWKGTKSCVRSISATRNQAREREDRREKGMSKPFFKQNLIFKTATQPRTRAGKTQDAPFQAASYTGSRNELVPKMLTPD
jgi:hypothetical protein